MKASQLKSLIRECIEEVLTEASLNRDLDSFLSTIKDPHIQTLMANYVVPALQKSTEDIGQKLEYIKSLRMMILEPEKAPKWLIGRFDQLGIDVRNPKVKAELNRLLPILSEFQKFIERQRVST